MFTLNKYHVIGTGMIGNEFKNHPEPDLNICLYAAGVSNSSCTDANEYLRDSELIKKTLSQLPEEIKLIYISTCSIESSNQSKTPYIEHKKNMENLVLSRGNSKIARLPQVAGNSNNPHTLLNFLHNKIKNFEPVTIKNLATRNIIDVTDVHRIIIDILKNENFIDIPDVLNVANITDISISNLVEIFESELNVSCEKIFTNDGDITKINTDWIKSSIERSGVAFDSKYINNLVRYYYARS